MHLIIDGRPILLTTDAEGSSAVFELDGAKYIAHVTVTAMTPASRPAVTPAKAAFA